MVRIFIAYSSKDLVFKDEIRKRLRPLQRIGKVDIWDNYDIEAGAAWDTVVQEKIEQSDLILLLLSPDALNSDYFYDVEAPIALRRHEAGEAVAVGILLRPCDLKYTPFGDLTKYELLPKKGYPVTDRHWRTFDDAYLTIFREVDLLVEKIEHKREAGKPEVPLFEKKVDNPRSKAKMTVSVAKLPPAKPAVKDASTKAPKKAKQSDKNRFEEKFIATKVLEAGRSEDVNPLYELILFEAGPNKISVVKEVKDLIGLPLANVKNLVDSPPFLLKGGVNKEEAKRIKSIFEALDAVVEVLPEQSVSGRD